MQKKKKFYWTFLFVSANCNSVELVKLIEIVL